MPALASADAAVLERLSAALGPEGAIPPEPRYLEEPRGRYHGQAAAVLRPASVAEVQAGGADLRRGAGRHRALFRRHRAGRRADHDRWPAAGDPVAGAAAPRPRPRPDRQCADRRGRRGAGRRPGGGARGGSGVSAVARLRRARRGSAGCSAPTPAGSTCCATAMPATSASASRRCWPTAACSMGSAGCTRTTWAMTCGTC